jgi:hypothetical protein
LPVRGIRKLRISRSRGREYVQLVIYSWAAKEQRGRTIVLQHLGPLEAVERERPQLESQIGHLRRRMRSHQKRSHSQSESKAATTHGSSGVMERDLDEFHARVLKLVRELPTPVGRRALFKLAEAERFHPIGLNQNLPDDIGKALTQLHRWGFLARQGSGGIRQPYRYRAR